MTIPLYKEYDEIAPIWVRQTQQEDLIKSSFNKENKEYNIGNVQSCLCAEVYLWDMDYRENCDQCDKFGFLFFDLIRVIPENLGIKWWTTPKDEWKNKLLSEINTITSRRSLAIKEMLEMYDSKIDNYRDLFNCFANNYIQHLSKCDFYAETVAIRR